MDQVWETLMKINTSDDKLQKNQTVAQAKSHSNFVDMDKLENSSGTTPQTRIPVYGFRNKSTITPDIEPI